MEKSCTKLVQEWIALVDEDYELAQRELRNRDGVRATLAFRAARGREAWPQQTQDQACHGVEATQGVARSPHALRRE